MKKRNQLYVGTWNVNGISKQEKLENLANEVKRYELDVLAIQETKLCENSREELFNGVVFYNSGIPGDLVHGVGFMIQERVSSNVIDIKFKPVSATICVLRLKGTRQNVTFINVHAPPKNNPDEVKDKFYKILQKQYWKIPNDDIKVVLGDCNAQIGREEIYMPTIWMYSKHEESNSNGERLIEFAIEKKLVIRSTFFKSQHQGTWTSNNNSIVNQIDHILIEARHASLINRIRHEPEKKIKTDHNLVVGEFTVPSRKKNCKKNRRKIVYISIKPNVKQLPRKKKYIEYKIEQIKKKYLMYFNKKLLEEMKARIRKMRVWNEDEWDDGEWDDGEWDDDEEIACSETIESDEDGWVQHEEMPIPWLQTSLFKKKGNNSDSKKYERIPNSTCKLCLKILNDRWCAFAESSLGEYQAGFRKNRSAIDHIFTLKELQLTSYEYNIVLHTILLNFEQLIKMSLMDITNIILDYKVKYANETISNLLRVENGVRPGDPLSNTILNLVLEEIIRRAEINRTGIIYDNKHQCLAYGWNLMLIAKTKEELTGCLERFDKEATYMGFEIKKGNYMVMGKSIHEESQKVQEINYLGVQITDKPNEKLLISQRLACGSKCCAAFQAYMKSKHVSINGKQMIYTGVIRPCVLYGCETWTMEDADVKRLQRWERRILRLIIPRIEIDGVWDKTTDKDVMNRYNYPSIIATIKSRRIRWAGRIARMPEKRMPKRVVFERPDKARRCGKPRKRWEEALLEDLQKLNVTKDEWREKAKNKTEWKELVNLALHTLDN